MSLFKSKKALIIFAGIIAGIIILIPIINIYQTIVKNNKEVAMLRQRGVSPDAHRVVITKGTFSDDKLTIKPNDTLVFFTQDQGINYHLLMNGFQIATIRGKITPSGPDELFNFILPAPGVVTFSVFSDQNDAEDSLTVTIKS